MNNLELTFQNSQVRIQEKNNEAWFCLKDVCDILELSNSRKVVERLNEKGVTTSDTLTKGGMQKMTFINESNLYKVIFQSRKPQAEQFTEWVTGEVLPTIRKTGAYQVPTNPMQALELMFQAQKETNTLVAQHDERLKVLEEDKLLSTGEYNYVGRAIKNKVNETLKVLNTQNFSVRSKVYSSINRDLNNYIGIRTRSQLRAKDFDKSIEFIENWQLSYTDKRIIEQLSLDV